SSKEGKENLLDHFSPNTVSQMSSPSGVALIHLLRRFKCVNLRGCPVMANPHDPWKPQRVAARVAIALLNAVESDFNDHNGFNQAEPAVVLNRVLLEELCHFCDLDVGQSRVRLP